MAVRGAGGGAGGGAGTDWRLFGAVAFTVVAWASAFVVIRFVAHDFSPGALTLGRLLVGSLVLSTLMLGRRLVRLTGRDWALVVLIGLAWFGVYNIALNAGEQRVDAGTAAMLIQLAPILIGVLAGVLLGEGFPRMLVIGGLVAFAGTVVIGVATSTGHADVAGVLLVLLSATVYAVAMVAQKVVLRRLPAIQVTWLACAVGTIACLPFAGSLVAEVAAASATPILGVVYLGPGADGTRLLDLGVRAQPQLGRQARRDHLRGPAHRDRPRLDPAGRGAGAAGRRRRGAAGWRWRLGRVGVALAR